MPMKLDQNAWHLLGRGSNGCLGAYARIVRPGTRYQVPALGRIITPKAFRSTGLGRQLVQTCIDKCILEYSGMDIFISAQTYLIGFYRGFGFTTMGTSYDDEGITHIDMILRAPARAVNRCLIEKTS